MRKRAASYGPPSTTTTAVQLTLTLTLTLTTIYYNYCSTARLLVLAHGHIARRAAVVALGEHLVELERHARVLDSQPVVLHLRVAEGTWPLGLGLGLGLASPWLSIFVWRKAPGR